MKRKQIQLLQVLTNPYKAPSRFGRMFKENDTEGVGGYDLSTKEGAEAFIKKNKEMILEIPEVKKVGLLDVAVKALQKTNTELEKKVANMKSVDTEEWKGVTEQLKQLGVDMKSVKDNSNHKPSEHPKGSIAEMLFKNKAKIDDFLTRKSGSLMLEYKAVDTNTDIGSGDGANNLIGRDAYFTWHEGGMVGRIPVRRPFMREIFRNVPVGTEWIKFIDQDTVVRNASNVALCGTTTSNTKVTFKVYTVEIQKVRDFMDVCLDMMSDYGFVQGEINRLLNESLDLKIDNDLLLGTGVAPILNGVAKTASTFAANNPSANFSAFVPNAQLIDLISIAGAQIKIFGQLNMFWPNVVLLNPVDHQGIKALKNSFGDYIRNNQLISSLFVDGQGNYFIDGMRLIENPLVAANTFYIFDSTKATVYSKPGVGIEFAYENRSNFETETVTVKIYERLNMVIRNVDANAFMFVPDIAGAIAAINKPMAP